MMDCIFLLSQEHEDMPRAEAEAVLNAENIQYEVYRTNLGDRCSSTNPEESCDDEQEQLLFLETEELEKAQVERLAMTFEVCELLHEFGPDNYQKLAATQPVSTDKPFAVRKMYIDDTEAPDELESNVGRIIDKASDGHVELDGPEVVFRIYLYNDTAYLCRVIADIDRSQYEPRKNQYRPYSSPVSMHPRLARTLVNLSEVPRDGTLLDPFCGTGGLLLEAGLIGVDVYGLDIQEEMVEGSRENLESFRVDGDVRQGTFEDIEDIFKDELPFDAVVTDLPYGKASKVEGDPTEAFLETAPDLTDGKVVFMTDTEELDSLEPEFEIYVHRSLSRYVYIID